MNSRACIYCYDAGFVKCLFASSVQNNLPTYEQEMAVQDILNFDSITITRQEAACYSWKESDAIPEEDSYSVAEQACSFRVYRDMVDITEHTLDGQ
jgi:hypothetical protein